MLYSFDGMVLETRNDIVTEILANVMETVFNRYPMKYLHG